MRKRVCVLVSGGMDSCALIADMLRRGREVYPLYLKSGFRWEETELRWLRRFLRAIRAPRLRPLTVTEAPMASVLGTHWSMGGPGVPPAGGSWDSVYLPGRNLVLISHAGVFCLQNQIGVVALATLKGNLFPDASRSFRTRMEKALEAGLDRKIKIESPYFRLTKAQVMARAKGVPLKLTFSCLDPKRERHCGVCNKCEERQWLGL